MPLNRVVNEACLAFLQGGDGERLRLEAELVALTREERKLRQQWRLIGRSGSYIDAYVDQVLKPQDSRYRLEVRRRRRDPFCYGGGERPLRALSRDEEEVFRRILARREAIAIRVVEIMKLLLPKEKYRLKPGRKPRRKSRSRVTRKAEKEVS